MSLAVLVVVYTFVCACEILVGARAASHTAPPPTNGWRADTQQVPDTPERVAQRIEQRATAYERSGDTTNARQARAWARIARRAVDVAAARDAERAFTRGDALPSAIPPRRLRPTGSM